MFKNEETYTANNQMAGLTYDATIGDLIDNDADQDGVPDWQESLYGLDPTKKETVPGTPDIATINKLKTEQGSNVEITSGDEQNVENLTETDKFSRELFSTAASLTQNGFINETTADEIGSSLSDRIKNSSPRKVFSFSDIKIDPSQNQKSYTDALINISKKNKIPDYTAVDVLQKFIIDENNVDASVLIELDPIIKSADGIIAGLTKMTVPAPFASVHIDFLNSWERIMENLSDIRLYDTDPVVALTGISQYGDNFILLMSANNSLTDIINNKNEF